MGWRSKGMRFGQFAVLAMLVGEVSYAAAEISSAAAEVLVLRSGGPSATRYRAGQKLPDNATFNLRPGDSVVVLARGGTRTFRGPGVFSANGPVRAGQLASANVRRTTGSVRSADGGGAQVMQPGNVWHVDVTTSGRACVAAGQAPILWRPDASRAVDLTITSQTGGVETVTWAKDQTTLIWPTAIPVADGASYQLNWEGARAPSRLTTRVVQPLPATDSEGLASALLANSCRSQLDVFIAQNEMPEDRVAASGGGGAAQ